MSAHPPLKVALMAGLALLAGGAPASTYGHHPTSRTVIKTYGYAPPAMSAAVPIVYGAAPGAVAGPVTHGTVPVVPWAHSSAASLGVASVGYAPAGYTTSSILPSVASGYAPAGYQVASYAPASVGYAPAATYASYVPATTYAAYAPASVASYRPYSPASTVDAAAAEEAARFDAFRRSGVASIASGSSPEYQIASSARHQDLARRVGGAGVLSRIGQYLRQFVGSPLFKETADNLFRSFLPELPFVQPLVDNFLDDLHRGGSAAPDPGADRAPGIPRTPGAGGAQADQGTSSDVTIRIRIIVEKDGGGSDDPPPPPPRSLFPPATPRAPRSPAGAAKVFFVPDDKVVSQPQSGGPVTVERDGAAVAVDAPGTFQAGDVIVSDLGGGIYTIKRGGKMLLYNGNKATAEGINPKVMDVP